MTPGLINVHNHFGYGALGEHSGLILSCPNVSSIDDIQAPVESRATDKAMALVSYKRSWQPK